MTISLTPVIPPEIPRKPEPKEPGRLFCTADHRAWLLPVPCVDGDCHWVWDRQPYEVDASPMYVSVEDPTVREPLTSLAERPGFHSLSASHVGEDYIRTAVRA